VSKLDGGYRGRGFLSAGTKLKGPGKLSNPRAMIVSPGKKGGRHSLPLSANRETRVPILLGAIHWYDGDDNLTMWQDAGSTQCIANNHNIAQWDDKGSRNTLLNAAAASQPDLRTGVGGTLTWMVDFGDTGGDDDLEANSGDGTGLTAATGRTMWAAFRIDDTGTFRGIFNWGTGNVLNIINNTDGTLRASASDTVHSSTGTYTDGAWNAVIVRDGADTQDIYYSIDAAADTGSATTLAIGASDVIRIGSYNGSNFLLGEVADAGIIDRKLNDTDIATLKQYLADKTGLTWAT
jgi:hypothetical protein